MSRDDKPQFIEVTDNRGKKVTVSVDHVLTTNAFTDDRWPEVTTEINLAGGSVHAPARVLAVESYDEVRRLMGLDWLTCGEMLRTGPNVSDVCDRRLDKEGRCPIHGLVGA